MRNQEKCARHRQVSERTAIKHSNSIKDAAIALSMVLAAYIVLSLGMGIFLGVL